MAEDELTLLILERQRKAACEAAGIPYVPDVLAVRKLPHCDPDVPVVLDGMFPANAPPATAAPPRQLPPPLIVWSPEVTANCSEGVGSSMAAYRESSIELYLDDVPELTRSELYRISDRQAELQVALDSNLELLAATTITEEQFDAAIIAASTVEAAAAAGIRRKAMALRGGPTGPDGPTGLYSIALLTALSRLVCVFESRELWVVCDSLSDPGFDTLFTAPDPLPDSSNYRHRNAGFSTSTVSVADATDIATLDALADDTFECVYFNAEVTVTCPDIDAVFDHSYSPAYDWNSGSYSSLAALGAAGFSAYAIDSLAAPNVLVYSVTQAAGAFPSKTQADADERARSSALRSLNCFFPSRQGSVDCATRSTSNPVTARMAAVPMTKDQVFEEMDSEYNADSGHTRVTNFGIIIRDPGPGSDIDVSIGLIAIMPAGMVTSSTSPTDADAEALSSALNFLSCFWVSPPVTCSCVAEDQVGGEAPGSFWWTRADLNAFKAPLNTASSTATLTFSKGELGRSEDGAIPVGDTMSLCLASLVCVYCNATIDPRCSVAYDPLDTPYDLWNPHTDAGLPLALTTRNGVSLGVSAGLPAGTICDSDPRLVNSTATATASLPPLINNVEGTPTCKYGNREITLTCIEKVGSLAFGLTPESAARSVTVAVGTYEADTLAEADALALAAAKAALVCEFGNPAMRVLCGASTASSTATAGEYGHRTTYGDGRNVSREATGSTTTPLDIDAYVFTSLESPSNAKAQALMALILQLDCFWMSAEVSLMCGAPATLPGEDAAKTEDDAIVHGDNHARYSADSIGETSGELFLARKTVSSYVSQADANRQAYDAVVALMDCFWQSARIELMCGAPPVCPKGLEKSDDTLTINLGKNDGKCCADSNGDKAGEVVVEAKLVRSYVSQEDTNRQAYLLAYQQLDCFWQSATVDLLCGAPAYLPLAVSDTRETGQILLGEYITGAPGAYHPDSTGTQLGEVHLDAGSFVSRVSQAAANNDAYNEAKTLLDCFWKSARVDLLCYASPVMPWMWRLEPASGNIREGTGGSSKDSTGDVYGEVYMEREAVTSYESQFVANAKAYALTWPMLDCFWQSAEISLLCGAPTTLPLSKENLFEDQTITEGTNDKKCCKDSIGAKLGDVVLVRHAVKEYNSSQKLVNKKAYDIAYKMLDCYWQSAKIDLRCTAPRVLPPTKADTPEDQVITEGDVFFDEALGRSKYCDDSVGSAWGEATLDAKAIVSRVSQSDANHRAYFITWPMLDCFWQSANITLSCIPPFRPTDAELLYTEGGVIVYGTDGVAVTSNSKAVESRHSQADANRQAYNLLRAQLDCSGSRDHGFGISGFRTPNCCRVTFGSEVAAVSKLYVPDEAGRSLGEVVPGFTPLTPSNADVSVCGDFPAYFYLEAWLVKRPGPTYAHYYATDCRIFVYKSEMPTTDLLAGGGEYFMARRLLAVAKQNNPMAVFNRQSKNDCAGLSIVQLVTSPQKLCSSMMGGTVVPAITDVGSPCGSEVLNCQWLTTKIDDGNILVGAGDLQLVLPGEVKHTIPETQLAVSGNGYAVLAVLRMAGSRTFSAAAVEFYPDSSLPVSGYAVQYFKLSRVVMSAGPPLAVGDITQLEFNEIRVMETLVVVNGTLMLTSVSNASANQYPLS